MGKMSDDWETLETRLSSTVVYVAERERNNTNLK